MVIGFEEKEKNFIRVVVDCLMCCYNKFLSFFLIELILGIVFFVLLLNFNL